jgi:iron-sulfur cluster repair protein YtfE (RIC family)
MLFYLQPKYKNAFAMFKVYEKDLHTPIHLENNILFAKAIIMD